ncbi:TetR/AcrR family transcriptional regulator [Paramaledivibacter caminithermalis]|uniref:Transcriptional regulator, TetR family n=1 Tax=Paramaledivibacter caminithermalis (strain DSM 15212 / CIP 107654 / DViRD3) TaxID=1121301 RepID=A0A1M6U0Y7_PARC5|nr:TetR/AcrR family transcriptional regulator [Paramaledivibacter caminithermalis]SHK62738.1 transcriptional regulator, TetR family [Paramaledivibacter caminithermalis DSM 15212]
MTMKKTSNTEERILDAAIQVFGEKGYSAATTSEIAKRAKVAEGTIFRYFPKKKELLHGIVLKAIDIFGEKVVVKSLEETVEANKDKAFKEVLKAIVLDRVKIFEQHYAYMKVILYELQFHDDVRRLFIDKIAKQAIELVKKVVDIAKKNREIKDIESLIITRSMLGMVLMMLIQRQLMPSETSISNIEDEIDLMIDMLMDGIRNRD